MIEASSSQINKEKVCVFKWLSKDVYLLYCSNLNLFKIRTYIHKH